MTRQTTLAEKKAIADLDSLMAGVGDPEVAHGLADVVLLDLVHPEVRAAYQRLVDAAPWWATA